jgi:hypothetical protein
MDQFFADGVVIIGSQISGTLTNESFSFSFGSLEPIGGDWGNGYTATAAFTSSATAPEPATIALFAIGGLITLTRKKRFV